MYWHVWYHVLACLVGLNTLVLYASKPRVSILNSPDVNSNVPDANRRQDRTFRGWSQLGDNPDYWEQNGGQRNPDCGWNHATGSNQWGRVETNAPPSRQWGEFCRSKVISCYKKTMPRDFSMPDLVNLRMLSQVTLNVFIQDIFENRTFLLLLVRKIICAPYFVHFSVIGTVSRDFLD